MGRKKRKPKKGARLSLRRYLDQEFKVLGKFVRYGRYGTTALFTGVKTYSGSQTEGQGGFLCDHVWLDVADTDPDMKPNSVYIFVVAVQQYHKGYTLQRCSDWCTLHNKPERYNNRSFAKIKQNLNLKNMPRKGAA